MENSNNTKLIVSFFVMLMLCLGYNSQAQEEDKKEKRRTRRSWTRIHPPRPVPPVQPVQPIRPIQPVPPVPPVPAISPVSPIAPIAPISPISPIAPIAPISPIAPIAPIAPVSGHYFGTDDGYELQVWKSDGFVVKARGRVRLERDGSGIRSIARGGSLSIKENESGQEIFVEEEDGEIYYTYYKRGKRLDFEGEGQKWFNSIWKEVVKIIEE